MESYDSSALNEIEPPPLPVDNHQLLTPGLLFEIDQIALILRISARLGIIAMVISILFCLAVFVIHDAMQSDVIGNAVSQFNISASGALLKNIDPDAATNRYFYFFANRGGLLVLSSLIPIAILIVPYLHSLRFSLLINKAYKTADSQSFNRSIRHLVKHYDFYQIASALLAFVGLILAVRILDFLAELK
ncbi:hypothetical protein GCM10028808_25980 [Spirosoma migulaei]